MGKKSLPYLVAGVLVAMLGIAGLGAQQAASQSATEITGWAWSSNIGWVSLHDNANGYGLDINVDNTLSGYAWSSNIGWISAEPTDVDDCSSVHGGGPTAHSGGNLTGWLKALAAGGGWDGCISLSGSGYGVDDTANDAYDPAVSGAWGGDVVGWLAFNIGTLEAETCDWSAYPVCVDNTRQFANPAGVPPLCVPSEEVCEHGCIEATGECADPPVELSGCLSLTSSGCTASGSVRRGESAVLYWDIENAATCSIAGSNNEDFLGQTASGSQETTGIQSQTRYTLTCADSEGTPSLESSVLINVIPEFRET